MFKINRVSKIILGVLSVMTALAMSGYLFGYIQVERINSDYTGDWLILRVQNNSKKPYKGFECQRHNENLYFNCRFTEVHENSTELYGGEK